MLEQGALSITGIQDIAALKIQSTFRGYRVRKTFKENKRLLMKHEQLKKEAARLVVFMASNPCQSLLILFRNKKSVFYRKPNFKLDDVFCLGEAVN